MFICQSCRKLSEPGMKPIRLVTERRSRSYTNYKKDETGRLIFGNPGSGWEIAKEIIVCPPCGRMDLENKPEGVSPERE